MFFQVIYWAIALFVIFLVVCGVIVLVSLPLREVLKKVMEDIDPDAEGDLEANNFIPYNDEKGLIYSVDAKDKKVFRYSLGEVNEVSEIFKSENHDLTSDENGKFFYTIIFNDGKVLHAYFKNRQIAIESRESLLVKIKAFKDESVDSKSALEFDINDSFKSIEKTALQFGWVLGLGLLILVGYGHYSFFYESEADKSSRIAEERANQERRIERSCTDGSDAISYSRQSIRNATTGSIDFQRRHDQSRLIGECTFKVFGRIEGENLFGGRVVNYYVVTMFGTPGDTSVRWRHSQPVIDSDRDLIMQIYMR